MTFSLFSATKEAAEEGLFVKGTGFSQYVFESDLT
jgi:hypothetical protein